LRFTRIFWVVDHGVVFLSCKEAGMPASYE
jgi:hypothetical protein